MSVVRQSWKAYMARSRWYRIIIAFCLITAVFDFAVRSWMFGFFMLMFAIINWIQSNPEESDGSMDWSWWDWGAGAFSSVIFGGFTLFLIYRMDMSEWVKLIASTVILALMVLGIGVISYFSYRMSRTLYKMTMTLLIMDQFPLVIPPSAYQSSLAPRQIVEQAQEEVEKLRGAEYERWENVKGMRRSRKVALAKVGIRPSEANNPEVKALSMEDLAVYNALKNELTSLASDGDGNP